MSLQRDGRLDLLRGDGPRDTAGERPASDAADRTTSPLSASRHSRLAPPVPAGPTSADPAAAEALCADLTRHVLGELAVGLPLLGRAGRRRARALTAWSYTLFDFARPPGLEGERLAAINRWEFATEEALDGRPTGEPIFLLLAAENRHAPWPREALDALVAQARRQVSAPTVAATGDVLRRRRELAAAIGHALLGEGVRGAPPEWVTLGAALLALTAAVDTAAPRASDRAALRAQILALRTPADPPRCWRRGTAFWLGAARYWLRGEPAAPLRLPVGRRLRLLLASLLA
jgi:hypothetical protein